MTRNRPMCCRRSTAASDQQQRPGGPCAYGRAHSSGRRRELTAMRLVLDQHCQQQTKAVISCVVAFPMAFRDRNHRRHGEPAETAILLRL